MPRNISQLSDAYRRLKTKAEPMVLATVVETFGSTYQKAGARMLIAHRGETTGLLGGGCFERDLVEQAQSAFETGTAKTLFYDMRAPEDVVWGLGLGCNGAVRVLLQLLRNETDFSPLNVFAEAAANDAKGVLVTCCQSEHAGYLVGDNLFLPVSALNDPLPLNGETTPFQAPARQTYLHQDTRTETLAIDGKALTALFEFVRPPFRLLVLGAGADALPLVHCAASLGWQVTVADYRPAHIKPERFPQAESLLLVTPEELYEKLPPNRFDALVLMTHNFDYDLRYLQRLADSAIPFLGLLGPAHRRDRLLDGLGPAAERIRDRVFGPVGLDIGAQSPEEIALSITAGIQAASRQRRGGQLDPGNNAMPRELADDCLSC